MRSWAFGLTCLFHFVGIPCRKRTLSERKLSSLMNENHNSSVRLAHCTDFIFCLSSKNCGQMDSHKIMLHILEDEPLITYIS